MIQTVHHAQITLPLGMEKEARAFYCEFLGIREIEKAEPLRGRGGFWLEVGSFQVHVGFEDGVDRLKTKAHLAYLVDDLENWRHRLKTELQIDAIEGIKIPGYERFEFRDPFGNRIEFMQNS